MEKHNTLLFPIKKMVSTLYLINLISRKKTLLLDLFQHLHLMISIQRTGMRADPEQEKTIKHDINYALDDNLSLRKMPTIHKYNQHPQNIHCSFFQK